MKNFPLRKFRRHLKRASILRQNLDQGITIASLIASQNQHYVLFFSELSGENQSQKIGNREN